MTKAQFTIRTFKPRDIPRLYRLQRVGLYLDLERYFVSGYASLRVAVAGWVHNDTCTYLTRSTHDSHWHVLQIVRRDDRPEWEVTFLAPVTASTPLDMQQWRALLERAVNDAVHKGVYRLYAALPVSSPFVDVFQYTGFRLYSKEVILRGQAPSQITPLPLGRLRERTEEDEWEFRRLWRRVTPQVVVAAEGLTAQNSLGIPYSWTDRPDQQVYVWEGEGTLWGAVAIRSGHRGRWVRFLIDQEVREGVWAFVTQALHMASQGHRGAIYCAVPEYVGGLRQPLEDLDFVPLMERGWMVRHLALPLQADVAVTQGVLSLLDVGGEPAFTQPLEQAEALFFREEAEKAGC